MRTLYKQPSHDKSRAIQTLRTPLVWIMSLMQHDPMWKAKDELNQANDLPCIFPIKGKNPRLWLSPKKAILWFVVLRGQRSWPQRSLLVLLKWVSGCNINWTLWNKMVDGSSLVSRVRYCTLLIQTETYGPMLWGLGEFQWPAAPSPLPRTHLNLSPIICHYSVRHDQATEILAWFPEPERRRGGRTHSIHKSYAKTRRSLTGARLIYDSQILKLKKEG